MELKKHYKKIRNTSLEKRHLAGMMGKFRDVMISAQDVDCGREGSTGGGKET